MVYNSLCLSAYSEIGATSLKYNLIAFSSKKLTERPHSTLYTPQGSENVIYCLLPASRCFRYTHSVHGIRQTKLWSLWCGNITFERTQAEAALGGSENGNVTDLVALCLQSSSEQMTVVAFGQECGLWLCNPLLNHNSAALRVWLTESPLSLRVLLRN